MKKLLLFPTFLLVVFCSFGQIGFNEKLISDNVLGINAPNSIFLSDINGDGNLDVISGSSVGDIIVWYDNIGDQGNFGSQKVITTSQFLDNVTIVFAADIDGDGDIDVLSSSTGDNKLAFYRNLDGQGTFGSQEIISNTAIDVRSIDVADIDSDGDLDVITKEEEYFLWYENTDGLGNFGEPNIIAPNVSSYGMIVTSDIDDDGDLDIVSSSSSGNVSWYENIDSLGDFNEHIISNTSFGSLQVLDMDDDGDMDIVTSNYNYIYYFKNLDGLGDFEGVQIDYQFSGIGDVFLSDLDDDGLLDIITSKSKRVAWYKNLDGQGSFEDYQFIISPNDSVTEMAVADADNDGDVDVFFVSFGEDKVGWFNNTNQQGEFWEFVPVSNSYLGYSRYATASDIDGDGDLDILNAGEDISWYENLDGQGNYGFKRLVYGSSTGNSISSSFAEAMDIDSDGDLDVLSITSNSGAIIWYENLDGQGNFDSHLIDDINTYTGVKNVKAADFDGDGDLDVVCASWGNSTVAWYENLDGLGDFGDRQVLDAIFSNLCVPADVDGDGDIDIVVAKNYKVIWLENLDGLGNFSDFQLLASDLELITDISVLDFDSDGDIDILFSTNTSGGLQDSISWLENLDGQGDFGPEVDFITSQGEESFDIADVDNDGDLDIVSSGFNSTFNFFGWFEHIDDQGSFNDTRLAIDPDNSTTFVNTVDIDMDGDMDVLSARNGKLFIYENLGVVGNEINGLVQLDINSEGCDNQSQILNNIQISSDNGNQSFSTFTRGSIGYQLPVNEGEFITSVSGYLPDYYTVNPLTYNTTFTGIGNVESLNFCITPNSEINDLNIAIYPSIIDPRPGFDTSYQIVYNNTGTTTLNGSIEFEFDNSKLNFLNASETVSSQTANTLTFDYSDLNPFESRTIDLEFNVFAPPTTEIDDILIAIATINPVSGDETEYDNVFNLEQTVIGSYDPNDITCLEGDQITIEDADKYLHYLIRFQNTGTADAINVRVDHILDSKLDWTTMQLESYSHPMRTEIKDGHEVSFIFNNINLPNSTSDEPNSHGFIAFKIKPKPDVEVGDIFNATADIYFDFNPAIVTNTASTEVIEALSTSEFDAHHIMVYPNPVNESVTIKSVNPIDSINIIDVNGRLLKEIVFDSVKTLHEIDVTNLSKGIYFLQISSNQRIETKKLIKR